MRKTLCRLCLVALLLPASLLSAESREKSQRIDYTPLGALITDVGDFDRQSKKFDATIWLWTLSDPHSANPIEELRFPNAIEIKESLLQKETTDRGLWTRLKIRGSFRHQWDMSDFPFDAQTLNIQIEASERDYSKLRFIDDGVTWIVDSNLAIPAWDIEGASLHAGKISRSSSFGDPRIPKNAEVSFAAADVSITLKRTTYATFWKLTIAAFVAAGLAIPAFFVVLDAQTRLGLLTASVFADVLSMQSASSDLGAVEYVTLVDQIHILVLAYTFIATIYVLYTHAHHVKHGHFNEMKRTGYEVGLITTLALFAAIGFLVWRLWST